MQVVWFVIVVWAIIALSKQIIGLMIRFRFQIGILLALGGVGYVINDRVNIYSGPAEPEQVTMRSFVRVGEDSYFQSEKSLYVNITNNSPHIVTALKFSCAQGDSSKHPDKYEFTGFDSIRIEPWEKLQKKVVVFTKIDETQSPECKIYRIGSRKFYSNPADQEKADRWRKLPIFQG